MSKVYRYEVELVHSETKESFAYTLEYGDCSGDHKISQNAVLQRNISKIKEGFVLTKMNLICVEWGVGMGVELLKVCDGREFDKFYHN